jgi:hypothetical protein
VRYLGVSYAFMGKAQLGCAFSTILSSPEGQITHDAVDFRDWNGTGIAGVNETWS